MAELGPKMLNTANRALWWVTDIADIDNPTATEINAGVMLSCRVTRANYQFGITGNAQITDPADCDDIDASVPGQATVEASFDMFRFKTEADDIAWSTFTGAGIYGYLVERTGQIADGLRQENVPVKTGDEVKVLYGITNDPQTQAPGDAGYEKFKQTFSPQRYAARAIVAAGA